MTEVPDFSFLTEFLAYETLRPTLDFQLSILKNNIQWNIWNKNQVCIKEVTNLPNLTSPIEWFWGTENRNGARRKD